MRSFSVLAFVLVAMGAVALTQCSSSSSSSNSVQDASTPDVGLGPCSDSEPVACPKNAPALGDPCQMSDACGADALCTYGCAVLTCAIGEWTAAESVVDTCDASPGDASDDASGNDAGDASDGG